MAKQQGDEKINMLFCIAQFQRNKKETPKIFSTEPAMVQKRICIIGSTPKNMRVANCLEKMVHPEGFEPPAP